MISGRRLVLRAIEERDLPLLAAWRNDPEVYRCFFEHEPLSLAMQRRFFERLLGRDDEKYWIGQALDGREPIGTVALTNIDWRNRSAELGRVLVYPPASRRKGMGREMCGLAIGYAFNHLNLNRLSCLVFADNAGAVRLYEQLGFAQEGVLRQCVFARGAYRDVLSLGLLRQDWRAA